MPFRTNSVLKTSFAGQGYSIFIVDNPTIDDVMVTEMRLYAASLGLGVPQEADYRVKRGVRDLLIRLGVER